MLVLSRKESQRIELGDSIVITIVKISGDKVRVGIEAPHNVLVLRDELEPPALPAHPPPTMGCPPQPNRQACGNRRDRTPSTLRAVLV